MRLTLLSVCSENDASFGVLSVKSRLWNQKRGCAKLVESTCIMQANIVFGEDDVAARWQLKTWTSLKNLFWKKGQNRSECLGNVHHDSLNGAENLEQIPHRSKATRSLMHVSMSLTGVFAV